MAIEECAVGSFLIVRISNCPGGGFGGPGGGFFSTDSSTGSATASS